VFMSLNTNIHFEHGCMLRLSESYRRVIDELYNADATFGGFNSEMYFFPSSINW
jgi:hypothetical protein